MLASAEGALNPILIHFGTTARWRTEEEERGSQKKDEEVTETHAGLIKKIKDMKEENCGLKGAP